MFFQDVFRITTYIWLRYCLCQLSSCRHIFHLAGLGQKWAVVMKTTMWRMISVRYGSCSKIFLWRLFFWLFVEFAAVDQFSILTSSIEVLLQMQLLFSNEERVPWGPFYPICVCRTWIGTVSHLSLTHQVIDQCPVLHHGSLASVTNFPSFFFCAETESSYWRCRDLHLEGSTCWASARTLFLALPFQHLSLKLSCWGRNWLHVLPRCCCNGQFQRALWKGVAEQLEYAGWQVCEIRSVVHPLLLRYFLSSLDKLCQRIVITRQSLWVIPWSGFLFC